MLNLITATSRRSLRLFATGAVTVVALAACSSSSDSIAAPEAPAAAAKLELSSNGIALTGIGATDTVRATLRDAAGNAVGGSVRWTSANPAVAEVSASGAISGKAAGTTIVTAASGAFTADVEVRVFGVRGVAFAQSAVAVRAGDKQTIGAIIDADASAPQELRYSSANPAVATVNAEGEISGVTAGSTSITATSIADPRLSATASITVNPARAVSFAPGGAAITLWRGDSRSVSAAVDVDANESSDIVWSSGNSAVATVNESGVITAVGEGTAIIRATSAADARASAQMVLTVLPARSVSIAPDSVTLAPGAEQQLTATVQIEAGLNTDVTWSSSDTTVATVSATGVVTAGATGFATITATSVTDGTRSGTAFVNVTDVGSAGIRASRGLSRRRGSR